MEIILKETVEKLGDAGEIVRVADGYARNYLIPKQIAIRATDQNRKILEHERRIITAKEAKTKHSAEELAARIAEITCTISRLAGEGDRLFGSVTSADILEAIAEHSITVDRRAIQLAEPIRDLGVFNVPIRLHSEVTADVRVMVIREETESDD